MLTFSDWLIQEGKMDCKCDCKGCKEGNCKDCTCEDCKCDGCKCEK